jgi:hypothetical protein
MHEKGNPILLHEFPTWTCLSSSDVLLIPFKKGTLWKVTKDTIDIENEELF